MCAAMARITKKWDNLGKCWGPFELQRSITASKYELCNARWYNNGSTFRFMESSTHGSWRIRGFTLHKQYTEYPETGTTLLSPTDCRSQLMFHRRGEFHVQQYVVLYDVIIGLVIIIKSAGQDWQSRGSCVFLKYLILLASYYLIKFFLWIFIFLWR